MACPEHSGSARWRGNPLRFGLYERSRSVWGLPTISSLHRGNGVLYDYWICDGVRQSPCTGGLKMIKLAAFFAGLIFGLGLLLAGMANPAKVLAFLDVAGAWDPSLALVMGGAISVAIIPLNWARKNRQSLLGARMQLPAKNELDARLIGGSLLFGIGWGIAGICPGPAVALLLTWHWQVLIFFSAMLVGMYFFSALESRRAS
ncbi:Protein II and X protein [Pseudomonas jessenii]